MKKLGSKLYNYDTSSYRCSECGEHVGLVNESCFKCGIKFDDYHLENSKTLKETLVCPACKAKQKHQDAMYCIKCGADLFPKKKKKIKECPSCNTHYEMSDKFCDKDGGKLKIIEIEVEDDNNPNIEVVESSSTSNRPEKTQHNDKDADKELPMNWYKFITYGMCPIAVVASLLWIAILYDKYSYNDYLNLAVGGMLINAVLCAIVGISLHQKTTWSWKFLIGLYVFNGLFGRIELLDEWGSMSYFMFVIFVNALTTLPNYIYYSKRSHLFVNKFEL